MYHVTNIAQLIQYRKKTRIQYKEKQLIIRKNLIHLFTSNIVINSKSIKILNLKSSATEALEVNTKDTTRKLHSTMAQGKLPPAVPASQMGTNKSPG